MNDTPPEITEMVRARLPRKFAVFFGPRLLPLRDGRDPRARPFAC
jgi:hypothetical protein